jgi:hypothetical protein
MRPPSSAGVFILALRVAIRANLAPQNSSLHMRRQKASFPLNFNGNRKCERIAKIGGSLLIKAKLWRN